ncbi:MAG TPA: Ig-like domain-containing protein [Pirellulales bacterium]|nr:Ig-like domain-containing protein [Pirellulales bacterium]
MGDSFSYEEYDGQNDSNVATVSINLYGQSQPYAQMDSYSVLHDHTLNVAAPGVLSNDGDPNHLHLTAVLETPPSTGSLTLNSDGSLSYTPALHYMGSVSFTHEAFDGNQYSSATSDTIDVTDQAPYAQNDQYALPNAQTFTTTAATGVLANDGGPDGDALRAGAAIRPCRDLPLRVACRRNADAARPPRPSPQVFTCPSF